MRNDARVTSSPAIRFDAARDPATLAQIIALGDENRRTLGFLPYAGFRSAAAADHIAVSLDDAGQLLGYCLFSLPSDVVRITHLCVSEAARGTGLSRQLVDAVSQAHEGRLGLVLKCRNDWPANRIWRKLDFSPQTEVRGKSTQGHPLTIWWRSHLHADLFSLLDEYKADSRQAAIDSNVYSDLHGSKRRAGSEHSEILAPLIAGLELNVVLLPSVDVELYDTKDQNQRTRFLNAKVNYTQVSEQADPAIRDYLLETVPATALAKDQSLEKDANLIAEALASGIDIFITRDQGALRYLAEPARTLNIDVLEPAEVPTFLDAEQAHQRYQPVQLEQTTVQLSRLDRGLSDDEVRELLSRNEGERLSDLRRRVANLAGRATTDVERSVLYNADGRLLACWATEARESLEVPLLRIAPGTLQATLAAQISLLLRSAANAAGLLVTRVTDPFLSRSVATVLAADGYYSCSGGLTSLTLNRADTWATISGAAQTAAADEPSQSLTALLELPEDPSPTQALEFERLWAPAKIYGQQIPNYLVPIRPSFASQLLNYPPSLMRRPDALGLSREHVYYSSRRGPLRAPARVLWYLSDYGEVFASSYLAEVQVATPPKLYRQYSRLGVWDLSDIEDVAIRGEAAAFRFTETEMFHRPVGLPSLRAKAPNGRKLLLRSAHVIDEQFFAQVYEEGMQQ